MKRPQEFRASPREWIGIVRVAYPFLREKGIGDLLLFGSQALSLYMRNPLRSKDLDLLSAQVSPRQIEALADRLSQMSDVEAKTTTAQTRRFNRRKMTTLAIELRVSGKPFFVEVFDSILDGRPPSLLGPYVVARQKWDLEMWSPNKEALLALRLAFRQPEGISRLNGIRLNRFVRENLKSLDFELVSRILNDWQIVNWVEQNLIQLYRRNRIRVLKDERIIPGIESKLKAA